jgi:hypothetical protein
MRIDPSLDPWMTASRRAKWSVVADDGHGAVVLAILRDKKKKRRHAH